MENYLSDFDVKSKEIIKKISEENKNFSKLINKLRIAKIKSIKESSTLILIDKN